MTKRFRRRVERGERGAALVEFALIFPIFMTLALGMVSGGRAYDQNISMTHAAREGGRYASTLARPTTGAPFWWSAVEDRILEAAAGDLDTTKAGHFLCVALIRPDGSVETDASGQPYAQTLGMPPGTVPPNCYTDGVTDSAPRVHVLVGRPASVQTVFWTHRLNLQSRATTRYEFTL